MATNIQIVWHTYYITFWGLCKYFSENIIKILSEISADCSQSNENTDTSERGAVRVF